MRIRPSGKRIKKLTPADKLFEAVLAKAGFKPEHYVVFEIWDRLVGRLAAKAKAVGLKKNKLYVEVASSAHMHDLSLRKKDLVKKINQHFGTQRVISDIILQLGKFQGKKRTF